MARNASVEETFSGLDFEGQKEMLAELTRIHQEAIDARRKELMDELAKLGGPTPARAPQKASAQGDGTRKRKVQYRGPGGEEYSGGGRLPKWATELGIKSKAEMEKYRVDE